MEFEKFFELSVFSSFNPNTENKWYFQRVKILKIMIKYH